MIPKKKKSQQQILNTMTPLTSTPVILTNDQIKALPSTYIEVLPAQGANKAAIPLFTTFQWHTLDGYINQDGDTVIGINYNGNIQAGDASVFTNLPTLAVDGLAVLINSAFAFLSGANASFLANWYYDLFKVNNTPLMIAALNAGGDFLGGHADNTLKVTVYYVVVDL